MYFFRSFNKWFSLSLYGGLVRLSAVGLVLLSTVDLFCRSTVGLFSHSKVGLFSHSKVGGSVFLGWICSIVFLPVPPVSLLFALKSRGKRHFGRAGNSLIRS